MNGIAIITVIGRLTADPEMRTVGNSCVAEMRLAVNRVKKGEKTALFLSASIWGKPAEIIIDYMRKGSEILLAGKLEQQEWVDKEGVQRSKLHIDANQFEFVGKSEKREEEPEPVKNHSLAGDGWGDEEIPF